MRIERSGNAFAAIACCALALGCSKEPAKQAVPPGVSGDNASAEGNAAPVGPAKTLDAPAVCPEKAALAAQLAKLWDVAATQKITDVSCAAGHFPEPALVVTAWIIPADDKVDDPALFDHRFELIATSTPPVVLAAASDTGSDARDFLNGYAPNNVRVVDLDGDGVDELLANWDLLLNGGEERTDLSAHRREGSKITDAGRITVADTTDPMDGDPDHIAECTADVAISDPGAGGARTITLTWTGKEGAKVKGTCDTGTVTYELRGGTLAKVASK